ncbi:MAG: YncE family protein [Terracidiphilus sp.]
MEIGMRKLSIAFLLLFPLSIIATGQDAPIKPQMSLAYVLDPAQQTVTAVDIASGRTTASVSVNGKITSSENLAERANNQFFSGVDTLLLTHDGSRLLRLRTGELKFTVRFGYHPQEKSSATIIDAKTMQAVEQADLGWGLSNYFLTPDEKVLLTLSSGYQSQKPEETLASELVATNVSSGQVLGRLTLQRPPSRCFLSKDGSTAVLLFAQQKQKGEPVNPAELQFVSIDKLSVVGKITFDSAPEMAEMSPSGEYLYIIEKGQPSNNPEKNVNGSIRVISMNEMKVTTVLDAGSDPKGLLTDKADGQLLLLSEGAPVKGQKEVDGELRVLRGASITSLLPVAAGPRFFRFSPDRKRLYVACMKELSAIDYPSLHELGRIPVGGFVSELAFSPDGNRGFALFAGSSRLLLIDLQGLKPGDSVTTGRGGIKFAKNFAAVAATAASATAASYQANAMATANGGYGVASYQIFTVAPANTSISVRPDGTFVYVLNSETNDVTIVDARNSSVVDKIAAGGQRLQPLNNGNILAVVARNELHLIDTATQKALPDVHFDKNLSNFSLSPDGQTAYALVEGSLILMNGSTGEVQSRVEGFKWPLVIVFAEKENVQSVPGKP